MTDSFTIERQRNVCTTWSRAGWGAAGICVLIFASAASILSDQFIYGIGHATRPIPTFLILYAVGTLGLVGGFILTYTRSYTNRTVIGVVCVGIAARLFLLPSNLIQENDCYRYVLDGEAVVHGVNPYAFSPEVISSQANDAFRSDAQRPEARHILSRISYQHIPTVYPPLAQYCFAAGAALTPWNWLGQRIVFLSLDIATLLILLGLLHMHRKPLVYIVLYAWNPLVIKEIANSAHLDSLVAFLLVATIWALATIQRQRYRGRIAIAGVVYAAAVAAKFYPVILAPVVLTYVVVAYGRWVAAPIFAGAAALAMWLFYVPFLSIPFSQILAGLRTYGNEWVLNEGAFYVVSLVTQRFLPTTEFALDRLLCLAFVGILACWEARRLATAGPHIDALVGSAFRVLLAWYLFLPAVFPWYALGLIAVTTLRPRSVVVVLSGIMGLYYITFLVSYRDLDPQWNVAVRIIEHGMLWGWLAIAGLRRLRRSRITGFRSNP